MVNLIGEASPNTLRTIRLAQKIAKRARQTQLRAVRFSPCSEGVMIEATDAYMAIRLLAEELTADLSLSEGESLWLDANADDPQTLEVRPQSWPDLDRYYVDAPPMEPVSLDRSTLEDLADWAYYDGTRRKPSGVARLRVRNAQASLSLGISTGMGAVSSRKDTPHVLAVENRERPLGPVVGHPDSEALFNAESLHWALGTMSQRAPGAMSQIGSFVLPSDLKPLSVWRANGQKIVLMQIVPH